MGCIGLAELKGGAIASASHSLGRPLHADQAIGQIYFQVAGPSRACQPAHWGLLAYPWAREGGSSSLEGLLAPANSAN